MPDQPTIATIIKNDSGGVTVTDPDGTVLLASEGTKKTLGTFIVIALTAIALGVLALIAAVAIRGDQTMLNTVVDSVQPGTVVVAAISAVAGIAAGIGLANRHE